jgi:hypothetical protein
MQGSSAIIFYPPTQEGRALRRRPFIAQGPCGGKIVVEGAQIRNPSLCQASRQAIPSCGQRLLPEHDTLDPLDDL